MPAGTVLDGELVIWNEDRLGFDLLQRRLVNRPARAKSLAAEHPATFIRQGLGRFAEATEGLE